MKALPVEKLPEGDRLYEIKHDGYRALAFKDSKDVRLVSRNIRRRVGLVGLRPRCGGVGVGVGVGTPVKT